MFSQQNYTYIHQAELSLCACLNWPKTNRLELISATKQNEIIILLLFFSVRTTGTWIKESPTTSRIRRTVEHKRKLIFYSTNSKYCGIIQLSFRSYINFIVLVGSHELQTDERIEHWIWRTLLSWCVSLASIQTADELCSKKLIIFCSQYII